jgi:diguanylate cyclase (GGDEF)-like protein
MNGHYDPGLVLLSYLVAILASYSALHFGSQLSSSSRAKGRFWLALGALTMGTGVWTMHFVGMRAHITPVEMTYDLGITVLSWLAAVLASAIALFIISLQNVRVLHVVISSLVMGGGISTMHYAGMAAINLTPAPTYDMLLLVLSIVIAIAASAAAMVICRALKGSTGRNATKLQAGASLVMGAAICGMHYTGMMAVRFPADAMPHPGNQLSGGWLGLPLALTISVFIALAVMSAIADMRLRKLEQKQALEQEEKLKQMAFFDTATGLPNRAAFDKEVFDLIIRCEGGKATFGLVFLSISNFRSIEKHLGETSLHSLARGLKQLVGDDVFIARYASGGFMLLLDQQQLSASGTLIKRLQQLPQTLANSAVDIQWRAGSSRFPTDASSSRMLIKIAMQTTDMSSLVQIRTGNDAGIFTAQTEATSA